MSLRPRGRRDIWGGRARARNVTDLGVHQPSMYTNRVSYVHRRDVIAAVSVPLRVYSVAKLGVGIILGEAMLTGLWALESGSEASEDEAPMATSSEEKGGHEAPMATTSEEKGGRTTSFERPTSQTSSQQDFVYSEDLTYLAKARKIQGAIDRRQALCELRLKASRTKASSATSGSGFLSDAGGSRVLEIPQTGGVQKVRAAQSTVGRGDADGSAHSGRGVKLGDAGGSRVQEIPQTSGVQKVRAARGTAGTFAGRRPPRSVLAKQLFEIKRRLYQELKVNGKIKAPANHGPKSATDRQRAYWLKVSATLRNLNVERPDLTSKEQMAEAATLLMQPAQAGTLAKSRSVGAKRMTKVKKEKAAPSGASKAAFLDKMQRGKQDRRSQK